MRIHALTLLLLAAGHAASGTSVAGGKTPGTVAKAFEAPTRLVDSGPGLFESYGLSLASDGDTLMVGAPAAYPSERVAFFARAGSGWSLQQEFTPAGVVSGDFFGDSVALQGEIAVVGSPDQSIGSGSVYVLRRVSGSWTQEARLRAGDPAAGARFGDSVAIDGNTIAVGASGVADRRGAVYVFVYSGGGWTQQARLQATDAARNDILGGAVAISGDTLVVGATQSLSGGSGAAYVFTRTAGSWSQEAKLTRAGAAASDFYGAAVALEGDQIFVGAPLADLPGRPDTGVLQGWRRQAGTWVSSGTLSSSASSANAQLGASLALRGRRLAAGAPGDAVGGASLRGSVEVFLQELDGAFTPNARLLVADGVSEDQFGFAVTLATNGLAASAPGTTVAGHTYAGAVQVYVQRHSVSGIVPISGQPVRIGAEIPVTVAVDVFGNELGANGSLLLRDDQGQSCIATVNAGLGSCTLPASAVGLRQLTARFGGAPGVAESFANATVQVKPDLRIAPDSLPAGQIGRPYAVLFDTAGTGATLPLSYSLAGGSLPAGLSLGANGSLNGTPGAFGNFSFIVRVSDSDSGSLGGPFSETRAYGLLIEPPFRTSLALIAASTGGDRGTSRPFPAQLEVIEPDGEAPRGSYVVTASLGGSTLSCSAPVLAEGLQSCSIDFAASAPVGAWQVSARFISDNADYGNSQSTASHSLFAASNPALALTALDPLYVIDQVVRFELSISNAGPDEALGLLVKAAPDTALGGLAWSCSGSACPASSGVGELDSTVPVLPAGASLVFVLQGQVGAPLPASVQLNASVALDPSAFGRELDPSNNSGSARAVPRALFGNGFED